VRGGHGAGKGKGGRERGEGGERECNRGVRGASK
jgi:hypothetical protein